MIALHAAVLLILGGGPAVAQDALRGKLLFHDAGRIRGSGASCVDCHSGIPGALHGIERAASSPDRIAYAIGAIPQMARLRDRVTVQDMADIAAYLARPDVPSPNVVLSTSGPAASQYTAERLEFPPGPSVEPSRIRLTNTGTLPLRLTSMPALAGPAADQFAIVATDCAANATLDPQAFCSIEIMFRPVGGHGLRAASVSVTHDWIGAGLNVALIGRVLE